MKHGTSTLQARYDSPLGPIILAATGEQLVGVWFDGQRHQPDTSTWPVATDHPVLQLAKTQLSEYFAGQRTTFELPLALDRGTDFQQAVWRALLSVPSGATVTYGELSQRVGKPAAVRAVGGAVGRNPLSIVVPCHRVLGANGALTGYAGGLERKTALLHLEGTR
ncbi:MAG: methylated-DNA--[protein]-cysteine S-methyltransferase [Rhodoferax sp.]|uniref:methylated-DNA--[protein]-cysteine S-methyltransferase n=1 Tax=Rhodoferax sp. TaxID=50421 RepID=UPI0017AD525C|nr:methylated-DNA--[protein]-cysteine S-methyltransferase [Rhodoferax sp.]NMM15054.1 methylated-DNA--[protein]-cysteine S-methyltransferase [Rhodoferax sp.]NMM21505.1 methylated-DNA--[protein]-cysteine S-methyltransferase [Rhodoferax sp.]